MGNNNFEWTDELVTRAIIWCLQYNELLNMEMMKDAFLKGFDKKESNPPIHEPLKSELDLCDYDIAELYIKMNGNYLTGTPIIAQLMREIKLLRENLVNKKTKVG